MSTATLPASPVLGDLLPGTRVRDAALVLSGTAFLAVAAQLAIPLWFTPVPLSLATFAVLLNGAALGPARGGLSVLLYAVLGLVGVPVFADHATGWAFASFGYVLGYLPAALTVGMLARRRADRSLGATIGMGCVGAVIVYAVGVPWLMGFAHVDLLTGLKLGAFPFLAGDAIKAVVVALLLPATWKVIDKAGSRTS
ncbi:biotin transporter BioY [Leekyejoonella antrihumi]|uniref:Biotin transporter n=1 Tax=Leekyejoonella antrihumi TaxID=1660198 RepID=A0A563E9W7_9MICO|nr:biotin transporter BioY [Leekyejoonella antrihumi]TWP39052.1 biotin transporter BioY [Leekyejoonella antrihumi]